MIAPLPGSQPHPPSSRTRASGASQAQAVSHKSTTSSGRDATPLSGRTAKASAQCLRPQQRGVRTVAGRNDTRSENGDCRRKGAAEPQQKGRLTKESRPPEQTIPKAGFLYKENHSLSEWFKRAYAMNKNPCYN